MSVSDIAAFKSRFSSITFDAQPYSPEMGAFDDDVAAVIVEPVVQAAAGMRIVPRDHYDQLHSLKPLLIVDEIATGFGRTGDMFASQALDLEPDLLCLGKGLSGGVLALSATLVKDRVFDAFKGRLEDGVHFVHGHSYAGNPIACAAALASLDLFEEEGTLDRVALIAQRSAERLATLRPHRLVRGVRQAGAMIGIELRADSMDRLDAPTVGWLVANKLYDLGYFTRPIGDVVQFVPPLSSSLEEVNGFFDALETALA